MTKKFRHPGVSGPLALFHSYSQRISERSLALYRSGMVSEILLYRQHTPAFIQRLGILADHIQ